MAIITKIREKSGIAVGVVTIAMIAFVLAGLFTDGARLFTTGPAAGEINGETIAMQDFNQRLSNLSNLFANVYGRQPQDGEMERLRQQVWQDFMIDYGYSEAFDAVGIDVTKSEMKDMLSGQNISPNVEAYFRNKDGQLDRAMLDNFLANYGSNENMGRLFQWITYPLQKDRMLSKYSAMLANTTYATKQEAQREYEAQNTTADLEYLYIPYTTIPDSSVEVSESELKSYYNANPAKYERSANRTLEYISFPVKATEKDAEEVKEELMSEIEAFRKTEDDSSFVSLKSDTDNNFMQSTLGELPTALNITSPKKGEVYGPVRDGEMFKLYKIVGFTDDSVYSMRARHILIKSGDDKAAGKAKAQGILDEIKNGADFASMAQQHGTDGTRSRGGDLGWFKEGQMVAPFNDAVLKTNGTGLIPNLIETQFGFHIVEVTADKTKQQVNVAIIEKEITPSDETINVVYREVGKYSQATSYEELQALASEDGKVLLQARNVRPESQNINNLNSAGVRQIIRWAYNDETSTGDISEEYDLDDQYVIAVVTGKREKGVAPFEDVKEEVKTEVLKDKQATIIKNKLSSLSGSLSEIAAAYGKGANATFAEDFSLSTLSLSSVGFTPKTVGKVSTMKAGETSTPIADENAVVIVKVENINKPVETANFAEYRKRVEERRSGTIYFDLQKAAEDLMEVKDWRYKYF